MRLAFLVLAVAAALPVHAERATERYAPTQLSVAREFLERARAAASLEEFGQATTFARQASLDARLAWGMTDAAPLRAQAEAIAARAAQIMQMSGLRRLAPAASYGR
jgi:hypothetical protein